MEGGRAARLRHYEGGGPPPPAFAQANTFREMHDDLVCLVSCRRTEFGLLAFMKSSLNVDETHSLPGQLPAKEGFDVLHDVQEPPI